ncbi:CdaR family transcriptional regulator [Streptomyces sp. NBC_00103]|uniref:PucR family transcriptional regulator n=1 Tax=Streptomyces sp. NBC_00103 TaxID=2975653 RepID=UPI00225A48AC|nr:helix-turn-helix domain-containing protein [Streptomyces sp. NBC_00103]MCX5370395.1 helix-turn-helix domain-containing protein [Streptomyces sp. NBC_00103]
MGSLFGELARQATANARREVETYVREIPELGSLDVNSRARGETLEYAVWFRHRTVELAPENGGLTEDDLGFITSMGAARAGSGMSLESRQRVLRVHTALMLREINEATESQRGGHVEELMRIMSWFAPQGERGIGAYREGFVTVMRHQVPYVEQVALLARSLLAEDSAAEELALVAGMELADHYAVAVIRVPDRPAGDRDLENEIEALVKTHGVPATWCPERGGGGGGRGGGGGELIVLVPRATGAVGTSRVTGAAVTTGTAGAIGATRVTGAAGVTGVTGAAGVTGVTGAAGITEAAGVTGGTRAAGAVGVTPAGVARASMAARRHAAPDLAPERVPDPVPDLVRDLVPKVVPDLVPDLLRDLLQDFAQALGRPCAAGTASAPRSELAGALDRARRISRAAPLRRASTRLRPHTLADVFVELTVADVPFVDEWLRTVARSLRPGPDLLVTLDAYYRHDMNRGSAATALNVHPRTLDYRLRRVRELTGIDPGSTHGVRILSAAVTRSLSRAWS